jgi:hypothetical protein
MDDAALYYKLVKTDDGTTVAIVGPFDSLEDCKTDTRWNNFKNVKYVSVPATILE